MQLTQVQLAQIVSSAVSQVLSQRVQQTAKNPSIVATTSTTAVQQVQTPIKFDVSVFQGDSAASWLTWHQRVVYQTKACGFEAELTAAEEEGLSVGADFFCRSNVDPVRTRNALAGWMVFRNNCRDVTLEIVQRSEAPNNGESLNHITGRRGEEKYFACRTR